MIHRLQLFVVRALPRSASSSSPVLHTCFFGCGYRASEQAVVAHQLTCQYGKVCAARSSIPDYASFTETKFEALGSRWTCLFCSERNPHWSSTCLRETSAGEHGHLRGCRFVNSSIGTQARSTTTRACSVDLFRAALLPQVPAKSDAAGSSWVRPAGFPDLTLESTPIWSWNDRPCKPLERTVLYESALLQYRTHMRPDLGSLPNQQGFEVMTYRPLRARRLHELCTLFLPSFASFSGIGFQRVALQRLVSWCDPFRFSSSYVPSFDL